MSWLVECIMLKTPSTGCMVMGCGCSVLEYWVVGLSNDSENPEKQISNSRNAMPALYKVAICFCVWSWAMWYEKQGQYVASNLYLVF